MTALCRFFKRNGNRGANISASARCIRVSTTAAEAAAEKARKNIADVAEISEPATVAATVAAAIAAARTVVRVNACVAELVISGAFFFIGQHLVGFVYLLELCLSFLVAGIKVRVILFSRFTVGFFNIVI